MASMINAKRERVRRFDPSTTRQRVTECAVLLAGGLVPPLTPRFIARRDKPAG